MKGLLFTEALSQRTHHALSFFFSGRRTYYEYDAHRGSRRREQPYADHHQYGNGRERRRSDFESEVNTPCGMKMPSFKTIYRWIDERYLRSTLKNLRRKGKTRKRLGNGGRFTTGKSIRKRDKSVYSRKEFGHWEADTVVSGQGKSKTCFATLTERKTRYYIAVKIPDRKGETMAKAIISVLSEFPKEAVKTITCDRGSEFSCWRDIEKALNCNMYFADPYCAWQKGTNENLNGLLREFYPKGRNLSRVSPATLKKNLALINARPKKVLHYHTPQDLFLENLSNCCT